MRVCQFRHFGTGHRPGTIGPTGSISESRKSGLRCQISGARLRARCYRPAPSGVLTPLRSNSSAFTIRLARVSSRLASVSQRQYSRLCE